MAERFTWTNFRRGLWLVWFLILGGIIISIASFALILGSDTLETRTRIIVMIFGYIVIAVASIMNYGYASGKAVTKVN